MPSKMKTCEDYRTALTDAAAASVEPSLELRSHLDACSSCRAAFSEELQLFAAIDTGVRTASSAEVPASLLPRIRVQLNERPAPRRSWVPAFAALAAVAALVSAMVFVRTMGSGATGENPQRISVVHNDLPASTQTSPRTIGPIETTNPPAKNKTVRAAKTAPVVPAEEAAVLVPAGQKQAMDALLAGVTQGQVKADVLLAERSEKTFEDLQVSPLDISPIRVSPLADVSPESASESEKIRR